VIPVIKGATRTTSKSFRKYPSNIPGKHEIEELQKKQPCWTLHTYCRKCYCKSTKHATWEKTLYVALTGTTE